MGVNQQTSVPAFTVGQVLTAQQQTEINTGVPVFADTTARDAAFGGTGEKVLAEGQLAYLEDSDVVQYYDGSGWATVGPTAAGGMTLLSTTTLTGATTAVTGIDQTYNTLFITVEKWYASSSAYLRGYQNADTTSGNYLSFYRRYRVGFTDESQLSTYEFTGWVEGTSQQDNLQAITIPNYAGSSMKIWQSYGYMDTDNGAKGVFFGAGSYFSTTAITSITFAPSAGTFSAGTVKIYGVK
jgi:hypothetical protein